ncbi:MAG: ribosome maturation factor RimP, partial [Polyangia bacterium]|nr:ribosome maturation factor RimP [Polyangia bacterium]
EVEGAGIDLVQLQWATERGRRVLRLFVDQEETGATLEDCASISRRLSHVLDAEDLIQGAYVLEVSTPGLDRPLTREKDFRRFLGQEARLTLKTPLPGGRKRLQGILRSLEDGRLVIEADGEEFGIGLASIARANLVYQGE